MLEILIYSYNNQKTVVTSDTSGAFFSNNINDIVDKEYSRIQYDIIDGNGINLISPKKLYQDGDYKGYTFPTISKADKTLSFEYFEVDYSNYDRDLTLQFADNSCEEIEVNYYNSISGEIKETETYTVNDGFICFNLNGNYNYARVYITKSRLPFQYVRLNSIYAGKVYKFNRFKSASLTQEFKPLQDDLPIDEFDFEIAINDIGDYNFKKNDKLYVFSNGFYGIYYVKNIEKTGYLTYKITAYNLIEILDEYNFDDYYSYFFDLVEMREKPYVLTPIPTYHRPISAFKQLVANHLNISIDIGNIANLEEYPFDGNNANTNWQFNYRLMPNGKTFRYWLCAIAFATKTNICVVPNSFYGSQIKLLPIDETIKSTITNSDKRIIGNCKLNYDNVISKLIYPIFNGNKASTKENKYADNPNQYDIRVLIDGGESVVEPTYFSDYAQKISKSKMYLTIPFNNSMDYVVKSFAPISNVELTNNYNNASELDLSKLPAVLNKITGGTETDPSFEQYYKEDLYLKYLNSRGLVKAKIVLKNEKIGDVIQIETLTNGIVKGIIQRMSIKFGYNDVADIEVLEWQ